MMRFGVIGLGFMGRAHLATLAAHPAAGVVAVHDIEPDRLGAELMPGGGNLATGAAAWDPSAVRRCKELTEVLDDAIDAVVVATPTDLHADMACAALAAGKHVFCEKPMALTVADCDRMLSAAASAGKVLMVGHCLRFWGEYAAAADLVRSGRFGPLRSVRLWRRGGLPDFGARNWFADPKRSGGVVMDLHVHDADYALLLLGVPRAVRARGVAGGAGAGLAEVVASYDYGPSGPVVELSAGWLCGQGVPFVMGFEMALDAATILYASDAEPTLRVYAADGQRVGPVPSGGGYQAEIDHFIRCATAGGASDLADPASSRQAVALAVATAESCRTGQEVRIV